MCGVVLPDPRRSDRLSGPVGLTGLLKAGLLRSFGEEDVWAGERGS